MTARPSAKRGQLPISESTMVLFIVVILIALGVFLYFKYSYQAVQNLGEDITEEDASLLLAVVPSLPELSCSVPGCMDTSKFLAFQALQRESGAFYRSILGAKRIRVEQIYPVPEGAGTCTPSAYNQLAYPGNCQFWVLYDGLGTKSSAYTLSTPLSLFYPEQPRETRYGIGKLIIEVGP